MMQPDARHVHPKQPTQNDSMHNDNYTIPNSSAVWAFRNRLWEDKYNMSMFQNADLEGFCHKGSNAPEFFHRNTNQSFHYLVKEQVFLKRMPIIAALQKLSHNLKRARLIQRRKTEAMKFDMEYFQIHDEILNRLEALVQLDPLRSRYKDRDTGHSVLYFDNTRKTVDDFLYGFIWSDSVSKVTSIQYSDKKLIYSYLYKYQQELIRNYGTITNMKSLKFLQEKMQCKLSLNKLRLLIYKYWIIDDDLLQDVIKTLETEANIDDFDEDNDMKIEEEIDTAPAKNKKKSEFCYPVPSLLISPNRISSHQICCQTYI